MKTGRETPSRGRRAPKPKRRTSRRRDSGPPPVVILGPQAVEPTLETVLADLEAREALPAGATVATVTAGWREREGELEFVPLGGRPRVDLELYRHAESLAEADPELAAAHKDTQRRLRLLRRAYNERLAALTSAIVDVGGLEGDEDVLAAERDDALAMLRQLDRRHLERVADIRTEYEDRMRPHERPEVVRRRAEIERLVDRSAAVVIAGGHVATLLNRLRGFGLVDLIRSKPIVAWSAGAMALSSRVLLFHDRPPWGPGNAEVFDHGLGLVEGLVLLPHATRRLALDDAARTARLSGRLAPDVCVLLDPGARLELHGTRWEGEAVRRLDPSGRPVPLEALAA